MPNQCRHCHGALSVASQEAVIRAKIVKNLQGITGLSALALPAESLCHECRLRRRLSFRNERRLYSRPCDLCGERKIGIYSPDKRLKVYCPECWNSDGWDPEKYAQEIDFSRSFYEQFSELWNRVPRLSMIVLGEMENSDYTNDAQRLKNCYLTFDGEQAVDCAYGETFFEVKDCFDFHTLQQSELCYECVNCSNCYNLRFSRFCSSCSDSSFLLDCVACSSCSFCTNLHQARFCIYNRQFTEADYHRELLKYNFENYEELQRIRSDFEAFAAKEPKRYMRGLRNEDVIGDNLSNSKDAFECYDSADLRDCCFCSQILMGATDCCDVNVWGNGLSLAYDSCCVGENVQNVAGCFYVSHGADSIYHSAFCMRGVRNLFGCVGLRHVSERIFNHPYSACDYRDLIRRLTALMIDTGELGSFFPEAFSDFGYNETMAAEHFPLDREEALQLGFRWSDYSPPDPLVDARPAQLLPANIRDFSDDEIRYPIACAATGRPFRITRAELAFYRKHNLTLPRLHPDQRHLERLRLRNPRRLLERNCATCKMPLRTPYAQAEVLCGDCYAERFYS